jgi:DNA-binding MarR family transcriptional regulator
MAETDSNETDKKLMRAFLQFNNLHRFSCKPDYPPGTACHHKICNLKYSEFLLLHYIETAVESKPEGVTATELSAHMEVKPPTINPLIANLEKLGLIERKADPNDRRFVRITMTKLGKDLTNERRKLFLKKVHALADYLGEEKSNNLIEIMNDIYNFVSMKRKK